MLRCIATGQLSTHSSLVGSTPGSYGTGGASAPQPERTTMNFADLMARIALRESNPPFYDAIAVLCCVLLATRCMSVQTFFRVCAVL